MKSVNITYIFGAKATAAGLYKSLSILEPSKKVKAFLVSDAIGNVTEIWGVPVKEIFSVASELSEDEKKETLVYVAVPELVHIEVRELLESFGFKNYVMLDSRLEADLMERYFEAEGKFRSIHGLSAYSHDYDSEAVEREPSVDGVVKENGLITHFTIYEASFYKDKPLKMSRG